MDRILKGFYAGIIGSIPMNILNLVSFYIFKITTLRFLDWAGMIMTNQKPKALWEIIFALIVQIGWSGCLGIILALLFPAITSRSFLSKGLIYTFLIMFLFRGCVVLFHITELADLPYSTSAMNTFAGLTWGLTAVYALKYFDKRYGA